MSAIYLHIPFCASRCIYCDFYSTTLRDKAPQYVEALIREMDERKSFLRTPVRTIYFGGGTPAPSPPVSTSPIAKKSPSKPTPKTSSTVPGPSHPRRSHL